MTKGRPNDIHLSALYKKRLGAPWALSIYSMSWVAIYATWALFLQRMDVFHHVFDLRICELAGKGRHLAVLAVLDNGREIGI